MARLLKKSWIDASIDDVWEFHQDTKKGLLALSPPDEEIEIIRCDPPKLGAEVELRVKTPIGRKTWVVVYTAFEPPRGSRPHRVAWFVDQQVKGPLKTWKHSHWFSEGVHQGKVQTQVTDDVTYTVPFGPVGMLATKVLVRPQLVKMFEYRHRKLAELLGRHG